MLVNRKRIVKLSLSVVRAKRIPVSSAHAGVLDVVPSVLALNDAVDVGVEGGQVGHVGFNSLAGSSVGVEVGGLSEEVGTMSLVRVVEDLVSVGVSSGGGVLAEHLNLPDEVAALSLGGRGLLGLGIVDLGPLGDVAGVDSDNGEGSSEGVAGELVSVVEEVVEGGDGHVGVLLVNARDVDSLHGDGSLEGTEVGLAVFGDLADVGGKAGSSDEGHDVGVVREGQDVLVGGSLVVGGGADSHGLSSAEVGELELEGKGVPGITGSISEAEFVGVLVHLVDAHDLGDDIEVTGLVLGSLEGGVLVLVDTVVGGEPGGGPLAELSEDVGLVLLEGGLLAGESEGGVFGLLGVEESPGSVPLGGDVELSVVLVETEGGSVESDDVTKSVDDGEVLESSGVDNDGSVGLFAGVERGVNNLEGAAVLVLVALVGEGGVDDNTVDVVGVLGDQGGLGELGVVVSVSLGLGGTLGGSSRFLSRSSTWHFS